MSVVPFRSRADLSAEQNLKAFIDRARNELTIYERDGGFNSTVWYVVQKSGRRSAISFKTFGSSPRRADGVVFDQPFLDFARAYVREQQSYREVTPAPMIAALKGLHAGLMAVHGRADVLLLDNLVIKNAKVAIERQIGKSARYHVGGHLIRLLEWLKENRICLRHSVTSTKSPWPRQKERARGTSDVDRKWQEERLLTTDEISALADAYRMAQTPYEVYWTSCCILLMFAPNRAGELSFLTLDCLYEDTAYKDVFDQERGVPDIKETKVLNIRWKPEKHNEMQPKPVHPRLEPFVREAIVRLTQISAEARRAAEWATKHPDRFYRHPGCITPPGHGEDDPLTYEQVAAALGLGLQKACAPTSKSAKSMAGAVNTEWFRSFAAGKVQISYRDLAKYVVVEYSKNFPSWPILEDVGRPVYEALLLVRENELHSEFSPRSYSWLIPDVNKFNDAVGANDSRNTIVNSLFDRLNLKNTDGSPIRITTHQIRVWLSTEAERGHMDPLDLAMFSGRVRAQDNVAYDMRTSEERLALLRKVLASPENNGQRALAAVAANVPVTHEMLGNKDRTGPVQGTGWGFCEHDWTMSPCTKHGGCLTCKDHACVKGLQGSLERMKKQEAIQTREYESALAAKEAGEIGADRWILYQGKRLAIIRTLIFMHESGDVPDGAVFRIPRELDPTVTQVALLNHNLKSGIEHKDPLSEKITSQTDAELMALLGA